MMKVAVSLRVGLSAFLLLSMSSIAVEAAMEVPSLADDLIEFKDFVAHNSTMTCTADAHTRPFNNQVRGTNLGGWMVLEPWITPSLFYQFLGKGVNETAFDIYTFCQVLGPDEANKQLHQHWKTWVTEEIIQKLADSGAVNSLRLPIGDYQFEPYGPYKGCVDGSLYYVDKLLDWAYERGISVLLDIHTMKDSQNGFDNSGQAMGFKWTTALAFEFSGAISFEHWPIRTANWVGTFDGETGAYQNINYDNLQHSLRVIRRIVERWGGHPGVLGLEPVNEPWEYTPIEVLKRFYWEGYLIVKDTAPYWKYVIHDSFRFDPNVWRGFMEGCPDRAMDTHIYQAWMDPASRLSFYTDACGQKQRIAEMEREWGPVVVGEWSLATDNCAMWLNGFNDNLPGYPRLPCKYKQCRATYLGEDFPGNPLDPSKPLQGPYGTGMSGPIFGECPGSRDWIKESKGNPLTGRDWLRTPPQVPKKLDDTADVMKNLALKKINAFAGFGHGFYFWNFRTDLDEPQWSYMAALELGWIPSGYFSKNTKVSSACVVEDKGEFKCVLKKGQLDSAIQAAVAYIFSASNKTDVKGISNMTGHALLDAAGPLVERFFQKNRILGATCDFGGIATLAYENVTISDDDFAYTFSDDEYFSVQVVNEGPKLWLLVVGGVVIATVAGLIGFILAMRLSPSFNRRVRDTKIMKSISSSQLIRMSLAIPDEDMNQYGELRKLVPENEDDPPGVYY